MKKKSNQQLLLGQRWILSGNKKDKYKIYRKYNQKGRKCHSLQDTKKEKFESSSEIIFFSREKRTKRYQQTKTHTHKTKTRDHGESCYNSTVKTGTKRSLLNFNRYLMSAYWV